MTKMVDEAAKAAMAERRRALLAEHGLMTEEDFALLLGIAVKTLRNRPASELPEAVQARGIRGRLFRRDSVDEFLARSASRKRRKRRAPAPSVGEAAPPVALLGEPEGS